MSDLQEHPLWQQAEVEFLRAERLLERSVEQIQRQDGAHEKSARGWPELERAVAPIQSLCTGLRR